MGRQGVITSAVSSQDWPGLANVDVSIVNWIKGPLEAPKTVELDGASIDEPIAGSLRPWSVAVERAAMLPQNEGYAFFGPIPGASGFVLDLEEAAQLLIGKPAEWRTVVRPYLVGDDLAKDPQQRPSRWIIDFGHRSLEEAQLFPEALDLVRERVKPQRDVVRRETYRRNWWRFSEPLREMRTAIAPLSRYLACPAQAKRILFSWVDPSVCPSNLTTVFAFDDDYAFGILSSAAHQTWLAAGWSTLEDRLRYTPSTVFSSFAWPSATEVQKDEVRAASRELLAERSKICTEYELGLTDVYNTLDDGGFVELAACHRELNRSVSRAYDLRPDAFDDPDATLAALLERNLLIAKGELDYAGP